MQAILGLTLDQRIAKGAGEARAVRNLLHRCASVALVRARWTALSLSREAVA
jgi:hypothetical protein